MNVRVFDQTACELGEGPLWHPLRQELFWFDIMAKKLYRRHGTEVPSWHFPENVSAAGWVDRDTLLVASASALLLFDILTGASEVIHHLEHENPVTRSNDGRADPWGGFWIGTMGKNAEADAGAIYRFYRGELRQLYAPITISNAICFSPDRRFGYFADTAQATVWRQALNEIDGWPVGEAQTFLDFKAAGIRPDGAVCDSDGYFWNAQWGAARLARYTPDGIFDREIKLPTDNITCPAFGGSDLRTLYATSARQGLNAVQCAAQIEAGKTFAADVDMPGQTEHQIVL
ncbi:MAG: SMP-30/gluconolactonase/LRE family protein [Paracoccaceae bacterium]